jgi:hypothetical protein
MVSQMGGVNSPIASDRIPSGDVIWSVMPALIVPHGERISPRIGLYNDSGIRNPECPGQHIGPILQRLETRQAMGLFKQHTTVCRAVLLKLGSRNRLHYDLVGQFDLKTLSGRV